MGLFLIGVILLFLIAAVGVGVGKTIHFGMDDDAPAHVSRDDWRRVNRAMNAPIVRQR